MMTVSLDGSVEAGNNAGLALSRQPWRLEMWGRRTGAPLTDDRIGSAASFLEQCLGGKAVQKLSAAKRVRHSLRGATGRVR
jgi:hypothetical protein